MTDIFSNMGVVGLALVIAFFVIDKIIPLLKGTSTNGSNSIYVQQVEILRRIEKNSEELLFFARQESERYWKKNGSV